MSLGYRPPRLASGVGEEEGKRSKSKSKKRRKIKIWSKN
jgi:hypothetical protein